MPPALNGLGERLQSWLNVVPVLKLRASLLEDARPSLNYLMLIVSSCAIATLGLAIDSSAVIIGAMIIAPLMQPLRGFAFAAIEGDLELLAVSTKAIAIGTLLGVGLSWGIGRAIGIPEFGSEVIARTQPTAIDLSIALAAGGISGYAKIRPELGDAVPGTAISVALMPPICVVGLTLSQGHWSQGGGATLLYLANLVGISLACSLVYVFAGYTRQKHQLGRTVSWLASGLLVAVLLVPLGAGLWQLVGQARLENAVETAIDRRLLGGREDVELLATAIDWERDRIELSVKASAPVTPAEVAAMERAVRSELGRPFQLSFDVIESHKVQASPQP